MGVAEVDPDSASVIGGRYRLLDRLGRGGMGSVFRVLDEVEGREVALKRPALRRSSDAERDRLRFRREFHTMAGLRHPRIVEVFDYGVDDDGPYYTMELLDGRDLKEIGPASPTEACALLRDVASALAFIHTRRLLHRDLAPRNVRCGADGRARLIDFGVLATFGVAGEIGGTPPLIAPENLRGLPLDHRSDLFGLGGLAYWLLTGRHAFAARDVGELESLWSRRPAPPSAYAPEVPEVLDDLVMSMLSLSALSRPSSAAEVIDRLGAIGGLDPLPDAEARRGYLASAVMVGRQAEMDQLERGLDRAKSGRGRAVLIEAKSGTGKSRLLYELGLAAQVRGMNVLRVDAVGVAGGAYGLTDAVARELLARAPAVALEAAAPRAGIIARVLPSLRSKLGPIELTPLIGDPLEDRLRVQAELAAWLLAVARDAPLAILVDDVQRCDEASAAVLASLASSAREAPLLLAAALRTDEECHALGAVTAIRDAGERLRLKTLSSEHVSELVVALFGDVANAERLARWMTRVAGGSPLLCTELLRHLVDEHVVRFVDGEWVIPKDVDQREMPTELAEAMDARIAALGEEARAVAEALSVYGGAFSLEQCTVVVEERDTDRLFAAIDELVTQEIVVGADERLRFRHDGLREALLRRLEPERERRLHRFVGEALAEAEGSEASDAEIGWHLLAGGERERGAERLERAGRALFEAQSFRDAIDPLDASLRVWDERGASPARRLSIRFMLLYCGCMVHRPTALEHLDVTVDGLARYSGVSVAGRLKRFLGRYLALIVGVIWAWIGWLFTRASRRGPAPLSALRSFMLAVGYAASAHSMSHDVPKLRQLLERVDPIAIFERRVPYAVYLMARGLYCVPLARVGSVRVHAERVLSIMTEDQLTPVSDIDRRSVQAAALYMMVLIAVSEHDARYIELVARMEALDLRFFDVAAKQAHIGYHRLRGEEERARQIETEADVLLVRLGSAWELESSLLLCSSMAYGLTEDVLGLKRSVEQLAELVEEGFVYATYEDVARGEYHRLRGELALAEEALRRALEGSTEISLTETVGTIVLAHTLLEAGRLDEAEQLGRRGLELASDPDRGQIVYRYRAERTLGLIEAARGDVDAATARLDRALEEAEPIASPTVCGTLHEARAQVAWGAGDREAYERHEAACARWFGPTRNSALLARAQRVADLAEAREVEPRHVDVGSSAAATVDRDAVTVAAAAGSTRGTDALSGCRNQVERAQRALDRLLDATSASHGWLYLRRAGGPPRAGGADLRRGAAGRLRRAPRGPARRGVGAGPGHGPRGRLGLAPGAAARRRRGPLRTGGRGGARRGRDRLRASAGRARGRSRRRAPSGGRRVGREHPPPYVSHRRP